MVGMTPQDATSLILASGAVLTLVAACIRWFYHRGGADRALIVAVEANTTATKELSAALEVLRTDVGERLSGLVEGQYELAQDHAVLETRVDYLERHHPRPHIAAPAT